ncbi:MULTISPECIES: lipopolysaccharide kinase InaA family protein [unclassified Streptomyces]|uniref:protein kinase domain-containing protein n=1 Tax=unclassified Streptomyces TaxID=2593676 RepID=UPI0036EBB899
MVTSFRGRPTLTDYQSAVARLDEYSEEPRLRRCAPKLGADGQPGANGGSFGAVYRLDDPEDGSTWALKCFLRDEPDRARRYRSIADCLNQARGSWRTEVHYVEKGLWVHERWWPVVLMEWVAGARLTDWIDVLLDKRPGEAAQELRRLAHRFAAAVHQMHRSGISHGDLQSGNVLVAAENSVRFVDYDAMTVPNWSRPPLREDGHPDFRLPREGERGPDGATEVRHTAPSAGTSGTTFASSTSTNVPLQEPGALVAIHRDRFPSHVIHSALVMLSHDTSLWVGLHRPGADHLLLSRKDFRDPSRSTSWRTLLGHRTPEVREAAARLRALLDCPVHLQPDLEPPSEVGRQQGVLERMAYRSTTGTPVGPRPFLDLGNFTRPLDIPSPPRPARPRPAQPMSACVTPPTPELPEGDAPGTIDLGMPGDPALAPLPVPLFGQPARPSPTPEPPVPASRAQEPAPRWEPPNLIDLLQSSTTPPSRLRSLRSNATPAQLVLVGAALCLICTLLVILIILV